MFSLASKKKIGDWLEANEVTLDKLAAYADPAKEATQRNLPQGPFVALVRKAKELRASDNVKKVRPHFFALPLPPSLRLADQ